jgi:hypothetical protein
MLTILGASLIASAFTAAIVLLMLRLTHGKPDQRDKVEYYVSFDKPLAGRRF